MIRLPVTQFTAMTDAAPSTRVADPPTEQLALELLDRALANGGFPHARWRMRLKPGTAGEGSRAGVRGRRLDVRPPISAGLTPRILVLPFKPATCRGSVVTPTRSAGELVLYAGAVVCTPYAEQRLRRPEGGASRPRGSHRVGASPNGGSRHPGKYTDPYRTTSTMGVSVSSPDQYRRADRSYSLSRLSSHRASALCSNAVLTTRADSKCRDSSGNHCSRALRA